MGGRGWARPYNAGDAKSTSGSYEDSQLAPAPPAHISPSKSPEQCTCKLLLAHKSPWEPSSSPGINLHSRPLQLLIPLYLSRTTSFGGGGRNPLWYITPPPTP